MERIKQLIKAAAYRTAILRRPSTGYCAKNGLLPEVFIKTPPPLLRAMFGLPSAEHASQINQDIFALIFNRFKAGYFVEIGANDGYTLSNTAYLEEKFGWTGILVEANPKYLPSLRNRKATVISKAIAERDGVFDFTDAGLYGGIASTIDKTPAREAGAATAIRVEATTLPAILENQQAPSQIDFISIDVEGGELPIVRQVCESTKYKFTCGCIEHNFRQSDYGLIRELLTNAGYSIVWEGQTLQDIFFVHGDAINR